MFYRSFGILVRRWVFEEKFEGRNLSEIINTEHENKKYLPGFKLPENVRAVTDVREAARGRSIDLECPVFAYCACIWFIYRR